MLDRAFPLREPDPKRIADALRADLEAFESELRAMPSSAAGRLGATQLSSAIAALFDSVSRVTRGARFWKADCASSLAQQVRRHPLAACAISLVIGALVVAAIRR